MRKYLTLGLVVTFTCVIACATQPDRLRNDLQSGARTVPNLIRYAGELLTPEGTPLSGTQNVLFALYSQPQGGTPLWQEAQTVVADAAGHFTAVLGATTPSGIPPAIFANASSRWLDLFSPDAAPAPRSMLVSVPYALKAHDADSIGGIPASQIVRLVRKHDASTGTVTAADLQTETTLRQQADAQVLQQAEQYTDNAIANVNGNTAALSAIQGETIRARQQEGSLANATIAEAVRAQSAESGIAASIAAAAPKLLFSGSPEPPAGYLFSGLSIQSTGSPTPEALTALSLPNTPGQTFYTLYLHIKN